jgi:ABC-2 type transport system permease protein
MGGAISILAVIGGTWFPIQHGFLHTIGQFVPSYWLVRASHVGVGGHAWGTEGWVVIAVWTAVGAALAAWAYRCDTGRV